MFRNLSIGAKIGLGFCVVLILLSLTGAIGGYGLIRNSSFFSAYEELAGNNNLIARVRANLLSLQLGVRDFLTTGNPDSAEVYAKHWDIMSKALDQAQQRMASTESAADMKRMKELLDNYDQGYKQVVQIQRTNSENAKSLFAKGEELSDILSQIVQSAFTDNVVLAAYLGGQALVHVEKTRLSMQRYLYSNDDKEFAAIEEHIVSIEGVLDNLDLRLRDPGRRKLNSQAFDMIDAYSAGFNKVFKTRRERNAIVAGLDAIGPEVAELCAKINRSLRAEQEKLGSAVAQSNASSIRDMALVCGVALLLGAALALLITRGILGPINRGVRFAEAVASGDFDQELDVRQRDQVGQLCQSLKKIADTVKATVAAFDAVVSDIEHGRLDTKADASRFEGGFATLIAGANSISECLAKLINELPLVFFTVDTDLRVQFLNKHARTLLGDGEITPGTTCGELFRAESCGTDKCFCRNATKRSGDSTGQTWIMAGDRRFEIDVNAQELTDRRGNVLGAFEICVDQTSMRNARKKMAAVAGDARDIADSLATASERLAGQVAQITGASEVQKNRMTETATAMEEMNSTVMEVARNAGSASQSASEAREKARGGAEVVAKSVQAIALVQASASSLQENMQSLGKQVESIGAIIGVINDIADQTNLLALNAAIEAARAGDAGRGFAVVADEVRKLAEKTLGATQEVEQSVTAIQQSTASNIRSMREALSNISSATDLSTESGRALDEIVALVDNSAAKVEEIATAAEQQSATSEEINRAVADVHGIIGETAEGMIRSSEAVNELSAMSQQLNELIRELQQEAGPEKAR